MRTDENHFQIGSDLLKLVRQDVAVPRRDNLLRVREDGGAAPILLRLQQARQLL